MPEPAAASDTHQFPCPHCRATVSARWEDLGETVECPFCGQPFEPPAPAPESSPDRPSGPRFQFQCLRCGSILEARASQAGQRGKCPSCAAQFIVPQMDARTGLARSHADPGDDGEYPAPVHAYAAAGEMAPKIHRKSDDQLAIECPRCHAESPIDADNCSRCGLPFTLEGMTSRPGTEATAYASAALVLGIIGALLSLCGGIGIMLGGIGLVLAIHSLATDRQHGWGSVHLAILLNLLAIGAGALIWYLS